MKFDGYLIVTDMDNTLLTSKHKVSEENKAAIEYFMENGGLFTVATGRAVPAAYEHIKTFSINAPAILHNGAKLYDYETATVLYEEFLADERKNAVKIMHEKYPFLGFEVYSNEAAYIISECQYTQRLRRRNYPEIYPADESLYQKPWTKLLMIANKKVLNKYIPIYQQYDSGYAVRSGDHFFDIVADGVSKGMGLIKLCGLLGIDIKNTIAVGDNMNDISLLETAGTSYAVENATADAKAAADFIAPSNNENAIAYVIKEIEKRVE